jgi:hypothetical protein
MGFRLSLSLAALLAGCAQMPSAADQAYQGSPEHAACMTYILDDNLCRYPPPAPAAMAAGAAWGVLTGAVDRSPAPEPTAVLAVPCACYGGRGVTFYAP